MANSSRGSTGARKAARPHARRGTANGHGRRKGPDAIALLKADHREVEKWFAQFEKSRTGERKKELAQKICTALTAHTTIEEEIFYPAFLEATEEKDLHHEAEVEHDAAKKLIAEIEASGPRDDYYDAKVTVLSEMIKHHVKEEEQRGGLFAKARDSEMELDALGSQLKQRKDELLGELRRTGNSSARRGAQRDDVPGALLGRDGKGQGNLARTRN